MQCLPPNEDRVFSPHIDAGHLNGWSLGCCLTQPLQQETLLVATRRGPHEWYVECRPLLSPEFSECHRRDRQDLSCGPSCGPLALQRAPPLTLGPCGGGPAPPDNVVSSSVEPPFGSVATFSEGSSWLMVRRLVVYWSKTLATPLCGASDGSRSMGQSSACGDFEGPPLSLCRTALRLVLSA